MGNENEQATHETPGAEDFDTTLSDDDKASLSPLEIAEKKAEFYKELSKKKGQAAASAKPLQTPKSNTDVDARLNEHDMKVELRMAGHSPEEVREIETYAKGKGISLTEAAQAPFVKSAIESMRAAKKSDGVPMEPSDRSVMVGDKSAKDIINDPNASAADKQAAHEAKVKATLNKRR